MNASRINLALVQEEFEVIDGELYKRNAKPQFAGRPLKGQALKVMVNYTEYVYYKVNRIIYALENEVEMFGELIEDDDGVIVAVSHSVKSLFSQQHKQSSRVFDNRNYDDKSRACNYMVRVVDREGVRHEKACLDMDEATKVSSELFSELWDDELKRLNIYNRYYGLS